MNIIRLEKTDSTNTWASQHESELDLPALVYCLDQTSGRGQRGNKWESEPGKNITASLIFHPEEFPASNQFLISEAIALSIVGFLKGKGVEAKVKWPNDIYIGDKKICGILVEHVVLGRNIEKTIAGFGININQKHFVSDAPNPVSLTSITGLEYKLEEAIDNLAGYLKSFLKVSPSDINIHQCFLENLWRFDNQFYPFFDRKTNEPIKAKISGVNAEGIMTLELENGSERKYAFKEIEFILQ